MSWYNSSWKYRVKITIDHNKVDSTLTDFPVYVDLSNLPSGFHTNVNQTDARDIRVTRSDGTTECAREVVFYDSTTDTGELHFKANSISSSTDTDFYIYYGNSSATEPASSATYGSENVWTGYSGVWHMGDASTTTIADSTSNGYTGTKLSAGNPSETTGKIGKAQSFSTDRINMGDVLDMGTNDITMSQWIKLSNITTPVHSMAKAKADATLYRYSIRYSSSGTVGFFMAGSSGQTIYESTTVVDDDTWRLITVVLDRSGSGTVYVNGSSIGSQSISTYDGQNFQSICNFWLGAYPSSDNTNIYSSYPGLIDESRITLTSLSATWISTEYNNQSSPSTFYTVGSQESGSTEANSSRGLYIQGRNNDNSARGLYIEGTGINESSTRGLYISGYLGTNFVRNLYVSGSQKLSTSYFNVVFSPISVEANSERGFYITGSDVGASERSLLLEGKPVVGERGLYLGGYIHTSSTRDLFLKGLDTGTGERGLYAQGTRSGASERSLYTQGSLEVSGERGLYLIGKSLEGERELYIWGSVADSSERKIYLKGATVGYDSRGLYIQGYLSNSSSRKLYLSGYGIGMPERSLYLAGFDLGASERGVYIEGKETDTSERDLYIQGYLKDGSNRKLYLEGYVLADSERNLYIRGQDISDSSRSLYILGAISETSERNIHLLGMDIGKSRRRLYIGGYLEDYSEKSLYIHGYKTGNFERGLYITGFDIENLERDLYIHGYREEFSEKGLHIHGSERSFSDRGLYIRGDGEIPFHEGNVIIRIDKGLYLNPKTGRIYVAIE